MKQIKCFNIELLQPAANVAGAQTVNNSTLFNNQNYNPKNDSSFIGIKDCGLTFKLTFAYYRKHDEAFIKEYDVLKLDVENLNMN